MVHELKILPRFFDLLVHRGKRFELRRADRDYQASDTLWLQEWSLEGGYSGRSVMARVRFLLRPEDLPGGLEPGYCLLALWDPIRLLAEPRYAYRLSNRRTTTKEERLDGCMVVREMEIRASDAAPEGAPGEDANG